MRKKEDQDLGAVSATAVDAESATVHTPQLPHVAHTAGPWTVETQWASDVDDNQFPFAHWIAGPEGEQIAEQVFEKPDAHLIAAAPDLLAALQLIVAHFGDPLRVARAAIAKAEGR